MPEFKSQAEFAFLAGQLFEMVHTQQRSVAALKEQNAKLAELMREQLKASADLVLAVEALVKERK